MIKLLIGGSPCTHWSIAQTKNRETEPSGLGWELFKNYLIAKEKYQPDYFLYENNKSMAPAIREQITKELGVEPILINSALVSAQNRQRLYWTNIPGVKQPEDLGILLRDILETVTNEKGYALNPKTAEVLNINPSGHGMNGAVIHTEGKSRTLTTNKGEGPKIIIPIQIHGEPECINPAIGEKARTVDAHMANLENCLIPRINNENPAKQQYDCIVEPVNITVDGKAQCLRATYYKDGIRNMVGNNTDKKTCVAVPIRVGAINKGGQGDRIYSVDGKSCTIKAHGGGAGGHGQGLYAVPVRVGDMPNAAGEIHGSQSGRIYSVDGKSVPLQARPHGGGADGAATGKYAIPIDYTPLHSCDVVITDQNIRCSYKDGSGTAQGYTVYFDDVKSPSVIAGHAHKMKIIEPATGKEHPVYEVRDGLITIKDKQYPIKLADGFYIIRKLTVTECKRLQTVPESYIFPVSDTQAYKMLGNGWTVDVIAHILSHAPGITEEPLEVLSMYDGMSCGHLALDKLGGQITRYFATEIDKYAIQTTQHNYPGTIQLGDAFQVREPDWSLPATETGVLV